MHLAFFALGCVTGAGLHFAFQQILQPKLAFPVSKVECVGDRKLLLRRLKKQDFNKGYLDLLGQLTSVGTVSEAAFRRRLRELERRHDYHMCVVEDVERARIVAAATLFVERKFIHDCGLVGHIEDVVVDCNHRGLSLGKSVVLALTELSERAGCYKVILDCSEDNVPFYSKCGLHVKELQMVQYFDGNASGRGTRGANGKSPQ